MLIGVILTVFVFGERFGSVGEEVPWQTVGHAFFSTLHKIQYVQNRLGEVFIFAVNLTLHLILNHRSRDPQCEASALANRLCGSPIWIHPHGPQRQASTFRLVASPYSIYVSFIQALGVSWLPHYYAQFWLSNYPSDTQCEGCLPACVCVRVCASVWYLPLFAYRSP